jgi:hypothetical protein
MTVLSEPFIASNTLAESFGSEEKSIAIVEFSGKSFMSSARVGLEVLPIRSNEAVLMTWKDKSANGQSP